MAKWFGRDEKPVAGEKPFPRWMSWLLFGFIGYLVIVGNTANTHAPTENPMQQGETAQAGAAKDYPAIRRTFSLDTWQRALDPTRTEGLKVRDFNLGKGRPAACGDTVKLMLRGRDDKGQTFDELHDETKPVEFTIGAGKIYQAVEQAVVGMRVSGDRIVDAPPALVYDETRIAKNLSTVSLQLQLEALSPVIDKTTGPLLVTSDAMDGAQDGALCGQTIQVAITLWDEKGEKPSKLKNKTLKLGAKELALGLDQAVAGITVGETRIITLPAAYQTHNGNDSPFDGKQLRVVEVKRVK